MASSSQQQPLHRRSHQGDNQDNLHAAVDDSEVPVACSPPAGGRQKSRRALNLAAVALALLVFVVVFLFFHAHVVLHREERMHWNHFAPLLDPASPVDRRRILSSSNDGESNGKNEHGLISVARMDRTPLGSELAPQWPLFWVLTAPQYEDSRCEEIISSWAQLVPRDSLVFIGALQNRTSASGHRFVSLPVPANKKAIKEFLAWKLVVEEYPNREWYVKGDDDTFFVVRNLNRYLEEFDPRLPYFLGCKFHYGGPGGIQYVSGGAGYVLSKISAERLASATNRCLRFFGPLAEGDIAVAECLQTVGVVPEDTRDEFGRQRFHPFWFQYHLDWYRNRLHVSRFWYYDWVWGPVVEGGSCCGANTTVSFHYMSGKMRAFRFPPLLETSSNSLRVRRDSAAAFRPGSASAWFPEEGHSSLLPNDDLPHHLSPGAQPFQEPGEGQSVATFAPLGTKIDIKKRSGERKRPGFRSGVKNSA